jgi:MFS-type transporter involved in bile tolerance (Atg22 family)
MAAQDLSAISDTQLEGKLKASKNVQLVTLIVFAVIIGAWLVLGYWREQLPVFISTVVIAVALTAVQSVGRTAIEQELRRRRGQA